MGLREGPRGREASSNPVHVRKIRVLMLAAGPGDPMPGGQGQGQRPEPDGAPGVPSRAELPKATCFAPSWETPSLLIPPNPKMAQAQSRALR